MIRKKLKYSSKVFYFITLKSYKKNEMWNGLNFDQPKITKFKVGFSRSPFQNTKSLESFQEKMYNYVEKKIEYSPKCFETCFSKNFQISNIKTFKIFFFNLAVNKS